MEVKRAVAEFVLREYEEKVVDSTHIQIKIRVVSNTGAKLENIEAKVEGVEVAVRELAFADSDSPIGRKVKSEKE
jgi:hypothetical protein